jgi:hypothetical protein
MPLVMLPVGWYLFTIFLEMSHVSLGNKIVMMLCETMVTQCNERSLQSLTENSTNFVGRRIWNNNPSIACCCHFHLTNVLGKASWNLHFVFFSVGYYAWTENAPSGALALKHFRKCPWNLSARAAHSCKSPSAGALFRVWFHMTV